MKTKQINPYIGFNRFKGYHPCSWVDGGGLKRESFTWFKNKEQATKFFPRGTKIEWPIEDTQKGKYTDVEFDD